MALRIRCPGCETHLAIRSEAAGRNVRCPNCRGVIAVPARPHPQEPAGQRSARAASSTAQEAGHAIACPRPSGARATGPSPWRRFWEWATTCPSPLSAALGGALRPIPLPGLRLDLRRSRLAGRATVLLLRGTMAAVACFGAVLLLTHAVSLLHMVRAGGEWDYLSRLLDGRLPAAEVVRLGRSVVLVALAPVMAVAGWGAAGFGARSRAILRSAVTAFILVSLAYVALLNIPQFQPAGSGNTDRLVLRELAYFGGGAAVLFALMWRKDLFQVGPGGDVKGVRALVEELLGKAFSVRASDVHLEPGSEGGAIRYRIDGILHTVATCSRDLLTRAVSRLKVMGRMDIAQKRLPQDGSAALHLPDRRLDLRISTVPSRFGERGVVRLLDPQTGLLGLAGLGLSPELEQAVKRIVGRGHGVFFAVGPTGCGKSTSLYATLMEVDSAERNVATIEDPVEYVLPGLTQLPVRRKQGMTFASGLRSVVRQDIDVVMVGEVRDAETANIVMEAAQTGHLVFSTLHTSDAPSAVTRLLDLGVEPYQAASSLTAVLAQRLVRRICPHCMEQYTVTDEERDEFGEALAGVQELRHGRGCPTCMGTGYYGRTGLFELILVEGAAREAITADPSAGAVREAALRGGMKTMRADGVQKALAGVTTLEEVSRATEDDEAD